MPRLWYILNISLLFDGVERDQLVSLGDVRTPSIADVFVALVGPQAGATSEATA